MYADYLDEFDERCVVEWQRLLRSLQSQADLPSYNARTLPDSSPGSKL